MAPAHDHHAQDGHHVHERAGPFSLLGMSAALRVAGAVLLAVLIWGGVLWAQG